MRLAFTCSIRPRVLCKQAIEKDDLSCKKDSAVFPTDLLRVTLPPESPPPMKERSNCPVPRWGAFTLVELLVGITIVVILAGLTLPVLKKAGTKAKSAQCVSNLRQIGAAIFAYTSEEGGFPFQSGTQADLADGSPRWTQSIFPDEKTVPKVLHCLSDSRAYSANDWMGVSYAYNYVGVSGQGRTVFDNAKIPSGRVNPGALAKASNTILVVDSGINDGAKVTLTSHETKPPEGWFSCRGNFDKNNGYAYPRHDGICNILWADGHVSGVKAPDGTAESLYKPEVLGDLWTPDNHWLSESL